MRYTREHKEQTAAKVRDAVRRGFRLQGYAGLSVDLVAEAAGVTSGAFYHQFRSKSEAFREVVQEGLAAIQTALSAAQAKSPDKWILQFSRWYLSPPHTNSSATPALPMEGNCALPTLSPELPRCDDATRAAYERELLAILETVIAGLPGPRRDARRTAWAYLALLTGAIVLARAVPTERTSKEVTQAALRAILQLTQATSSETKRPAARRSDTSRR